MKKMKRFFALFLAMAMVLGMSMTVFAAPTTENPNNGGDPVMITVNNIQNAGTFKNGEKDVTYGTPIVQYAQVIKANSATDTGWEFVSADYAQAYIKAYNAENAQAAILALLNDASITGENDKDKYQNGEGFTTGSEAQEAISGASAKVTDWKSAGNIAESKAEKVSLSWNVNAEGPGLYVVRISQSGYNYLAMAAYVGFNKVTRDPANPNAYIYPEMKSATLNAKGAPVSLNKENKSVDGVVPVGGTVEYEITKNVPYVTPEENQTYVDATYVIKDTLTGATYNINSFQVKYTDDNTEISAEPTFANGNTSFTLNLSSIINAENSNAGRPISVTYSATVNAVNTVTNTAEAGHGDGEDFDAVYGSDTNDVFNGNIILRKANDKTGTERELLAGAGFEVRIATKTNDGTKDVYTGTGDALKFTWVPTVPATGDNAAVPGYYKYDPDAEANYVTIIKTSDGSDGVEKGTVTVKGLALGDYAFKEVEAPTGYTINTIDVGATIAKNVEGQVKELTQIDNGETEMIDTDINSLPSTGGIGTTIFTVGGCAIMILAAGMFFVSRRRASR